jgi:hypothetical protein
VITIANNKPDWNAIRAEYIAGGIGQRKLAKKHGISENTLVTRAKVEGWAALREKAQNDAIIKSQQKVASMAAESAAAAERIRQKLLRRLEAEIDALPNSIGSQSRQSVITRTAEPRNRNNTTTKDMSKEYKLRDLTAAWRDLTDGLIDESEKDDSVRVIIDV